MPFSLFKSKQVTTPDGQVVTVNHDVDYFIAWWATVYARLAYMNPQQFLGMYTQIFGDKIGTPNNGVGTSANDASGGVLPTASILSRLNAQAISTDAGKGIMGLMDDATMLGLTATGAKLHDKRWGLNVIAVDGINTATPAVPTLALDCVTNYDPVSGAPSDAFGPALDPKITSWSEKVNVILGEREISGSLSNCQPDLALKNNPMLVFRAISDSNYGTTYVFGDKRAPNLVWIVFRGTANAKSSLSYMHPSSLTPTTFLDFYNNQIEEGLKGIFKILQEQLHMIILMAIDVASELNGGAPPLAPGSMKLQVTGHSLGGALATAFAGEYVQQISPNLSRINGASIFDVSIGCWSIASPRVFGASQAALFCCLTQSRPKCSLDPAALQFTKADANVPGRIAYVRIVTALDIVTALPKGAGYAHPCSDFKQDERSNVTMDCDVNADTFVTNKAALRCAKIARPAMVANYAKAPMCTDQRKSTIIMSSILYHLTYCGIMFAGGVDIKSAIALDVERLEPSDLANAAADSGMIKAGDTMMRLVFYNGVAPAKCVFFDLVPERMVEGGGMKQRGGGFTFFNKSNVAATPTAATPTPNVNLMEDSKINSEFIAAIKAQINSPNYNYDILDPTKKPPIHYHGTNYLFKLPSKLLMSRGNYTCFFKKGTPELAPPNLLAMAQSPAPAALVSAQSAVATTTVAPATAPVAPVAAVATPATTTPVAPATATVATTTATVAPAAPATTTATVAPAAPATLAPPDLLKTAKLPAPVATNGGRRTRRNKSNNRSRKQRKGKKGARISRRGNKRHTKRH
jgi:hypothetical protein